MKYGVRKPSVKKRVSARTKGKATRVIKKSVTPGYGKKGIGLIKNPKKAAYNKVYNKTTTGCLIPLIAVFSLLTLLLMVL